MVGVGCPQIRRGVGSGEDNVMELASTLSQIVLMVCALGTNVTQYPLLR